MRGKKNPKWGDPTISAKGGGERQKKKKMRGWEPGTPLARVNQGIQAEQTPNERDFMEASGKITPRGNTADQTSATKKIVSSPPRPMKWQKIKMSSMNK